MFGCFTVWVVGESSTTACEQLQVTESWQHIVAGIFVGGGKDGVQPDGFYTQRAYIVEPAHYASEIAYAIPAGILKALRKNLIDNRMPPPLTQSQVAALR